MIKNIRSVISFLLLLHLLWLVWSLATSNPGTDRAEATNIVPPKQQQTNVEHPDTPTAAAEQKESQAAMTEEPPQANSPEETMEDLADQSSAIIEATDAGLAAKKAQALEAAKQNAPTDYDHRSPQNPTNQQGDYLVIAGSFTKAINAKEEVRRLKKMGFVHTEAVNLGSTKYLSIIADRLATEAAAVKVVARLKKRGVEAYVQKKRE